MDTLGQASLSAPLSRRHLLLGISISHFGSLHNISNVFFFIVFVTVTCHQCWWLAKSSDDNNKAFLIDLDNFQTQCCCTFNRLQYSYIYKHNVYMHWETKTFIWVVFIVVLALLWCSRTQPTISPRYACIPKLLWQKHLERILCSSHNQSRILKLPNTYTVPRLLESLDSANPLSLLIKSLFFISLCILQF